MRRTVITTSHQPDSESLATARQAALNLRTVFIERNKMSLALLREKYKAENILVVVRGQLVLHTPLGDCFFHPGMSFLRIKAIRRGKPDHMVQAMDLKSGDTVLDCTLGLGADAIVSAFVVGSPGRVVGIEAVPELAYLVKHGLANYRDEAKVLQEIMPRIEVACGNSAEYLAKQADNSFDIVYFDPMFRFSRKKSRSMEPLRGIVKSDPLSGGMIEEAVRVARRRVVMKENIFSKEFARLGFAKIIGGKYSPIAFGVIDKVEAER